MKRLVQEIERFSRRLPQWASAGVWFCCSALLFVILWGWVDPFGLRHRMDWLVSDQFLRVRRAPAMHDDIVVVAIDDTSVEQFGFPVPRSILAGVIRQLTKLEARTILVDILFAEPQRKPVLEEANTWLLPTGSVIGESEFAERMSELRQRFTEDHVLARAMRPAASVVIPYSFRTREVTGRTLGTNPQDTQHLSDMIDALQADPTLPPDGLAKKLGLDPTRVRPLFGPALDLAMERIARRQNEGQAALSVDDVLAAVLPVEARDSYVEFALRRAYDRVNAEKIVLRKSSVRQPSNATIESAVGAGEMILPRYLLADAAAAHGFADIQLDADGILRRIPLVGRFGDRLLLHQSLVALCLHRQLNLGDLEFASGSIRSENGTIRIPTDSSNRLTVDWPTSRRLRWNDVIPMIPLSDIQQLDLFQSDANLNRHRRREYFKAMASLAGNSSVAETRFEEILAAQRMGRTGEVETLEGAFDGEVLPAIQGMPAVQEALERARTTSRPGPDDPSEPGIVQYARGILEIEAALSESEPVYQAALAGLRPMLRGKLCLIGDMTTGSVDLKPTATEAAMPGVAIIAAALNTMLAGKSFTVYGYGAAVIALIVLAGCIIQPLLRLGAAAAAACAFATMMIVLFGSYLLLVSFSAFISPITPLIGLAAVYLTATTYQWLREYRERKLVHTIFEAQTNPAIVQRLLEAGHAGVAEVLMPKNRQVTVLFAEIAEYENLVQQVSPEQLSELLSRTFGTMARLILAHEGTLDRYQGHAMVAFFGAPVYQPDHAQRACRAALECCDSLAHVSSERRQRGLPVPRVHVGLHTGELLVGNITLTSRVDYTVAGENLNVAYRVGELNELYGTQIMMSDATLAGCENTVEARELEMVRIKGRREPLRVFELMSAKGRLSHGQLQMRGTFSTGLLAFRNKDFANALALFRSCRETSPGDRPATVYIERCERELSATASETKAGA
jgi:class 3 adenylate cyclase/CHASE2 domain-containing sensor protein